MKRQTLLLGLAAGLTLSGVLTACDSPSGPAKARTPSVNHSAYQITIRYIGQASPRQQQAVDAAVARWRSVVLGELPDVPVNAAAGTCFASQPAINQVVDDLLVFVEFAEIDGAGKVLGEAGPCYVRSESSIPVVGQLRLDAADLRQMEAAGTLDDVVLHELGHVLGIGTMWPQRGLVLGSGGSDPQFTGAAAAAAYHELGGTGSSVPLENTGSSGTRDSHWRESVFGTELMTGYINGAPNPLSALTVASLQDLGYGASLAGASAYALGGTASRVTEPVDLRHRERVVKPKYKVDKQGRKEKLAD